MKKEEYKRLNEDFLKSIASRPDVNKLPCGVFYKVVQAGGGNDTPTLQSVVTVHYRGTLVNGREFDNSYRDACPAAFRLNELIEGWQQALLQMHVGDKWILYIPYTLGYGKRTVESIPGFSTLIFEIELLGIH